MWAEGSRLKSEDHARSELERYKKLRIRRRAKTNCVFTWKDTKSFPGVSKSNAKYRNRISYLRIRRRAKTEVIQYKLRVLKVRVQESHVTYKPVVTVTVNIS